VNNNQHIVTSTQILALISGLLGGSAALVTILVAMHIHFIVPGMLHEVGKLIDHSISDHAESPHKDAVTRVEFERMYQLLLRCEVKLDKIPIK